MADDAVPKSPSAAAADRIRETAKWLTVSLAGLGAVLVAGSQLSDVGALAVASPRFWFAVTGGVVAVLGTVAILALAIWIATTPSPSYATLVSAPHPANAGLVKDPYRLGGAPTMQALNDQRTKRLTARDEAERSFDEEQDPDAKRAKAQELTNKDKDFAYTDGVVRAVLDLAGYEVLSWRWRRVGAGMIGAGVLAGLGIGVFAWAANPPSDAVASVVTPVVLTTPSVGTLTLTDTGRLAVAEKLGALRTAP